MASFDMERFIIEIENRPAIWDVRLKEYSIKILKAKAWEELCVIFVPNFNEMDLPGKSKATADLQRKWKSLRDSFRRELALSKKEKSGSGAESGRKEYLYFKQLSFLLQICSTKPHEAERVEDQTLEGNVETKSEPPVPSTYQVKKKKSTVHPDEQVLLQALAKKANAPDDHDKQFLFSLLPDFKCIPEGAKLDGKLEIMTVIKRYKQEQTQQCFPSHQQITPGPYSLTSHASHHFAPNIMHVQSAVPLSQAIPPSVSPQIKLDPFLHHQSQLISDVNTMNVEHLINAIRERPALYDASDRSHRDRNAIAALWREVAAELNCTEADCKEKWRYLRSIFMRERRKVTELPSGSANTLAKRWEFYDAMEFLLPHVTPRQTYSNFSTPPHEDTCHETEEAPEHSPPSSDMHMQDNAYPLETTATVCDDLNIATPTLPTSKPRFTKKRRRGSEEEMDLRSLSELKQWREEASSQNDSDRQYLLSLLRMMKKLSPSDNIDIRIEICKLFRSKLFQPAPTDQYCHLSQQNHSSNPSFASNESLNGIG